MLKVQPEGQESHAQKCDQRKQAARMAQQKRKK